MRDAFIFILSMHVELNDIIAHEVVRNPLVAAMSACAFVSTTITDDDHNTREDDKQRYLYKDEDESIDGVTICRSSQVKKLTRNNKNATT